MSGLHATGSMCWVPSLRAFDSLVASIRRCQTSGAAPADRDPRRLAIHLWAALHGQVTLRMDRPSFPWPDLDDMITELVTHLVHLAPDERRV